MKKAEIIKNGNVNLRPVKKIDFTKIRNNFYVWYFERCYDIGEPPTPKELFDWIEERLS